MLFSAPSRFALLACAVLSFSACSTVNAPNPETSPASAATSSTSSATLFAPIVMSSATSDVLFGSREIAFSPNLSAFQRWQNVNTRFVAQRDATKSSCDGSDPKTCPVQWWQGFITELEALPLQERVALVNDTFNHVTYVTAGKNWGNPGYWETPFEFLRKGGQCQDYAIAKYLALLDSGVPEDQMRFVVVRDIARSLDHAVTVVNVDGEELVLDNLATEVKPAGQDEQYTPYYALNDRGWWLYSPSLSSRRHAVQVAEAPQKSD